jgi:hypothetical protein
MKKPFRRNFFLCIKGHESCCCGCFGKRFKPHQTSHNSRHTLVGIFT